MQKWESLMQDKVQKNLQKNFYLLSLWGLAKNSCNKDKRIMENKLKKASQATEVELSRKDKLLEFVATSICFLLLLGCLLKVLFFWFWKEYLNGLGIGSLEKPVRVEPVPILFSLPTLAWIGLIISNNRLQHKNTASSTANGLMLLIAFALQFYNSVK